MSQSIWLDEAISLLITNLPISQLLQATAADNHPPLFYLLNMPPIIAFLLSLPIIYFLGKTKALLIYISSPLILYFATEIRMYSLSLLIYVCILASKKPIYKFVFALLGLYTHYYFIPALIAISIMNRKYILPSLFAFFLFIPWIIYSLMFSHPNIWSTPIYISIPATFVSYGVGGVGSTTLRTILGLSTPLYGRLAVMIVSIWMFARFTKSNHKFKNLFFLTLILCLPLYSIRATLIFSPLYYLSITKNLSYKKTILLSLALLFMYSYFYKTDYWYPSLNNLSDNLSKLKPGTAIIHTSLYTYFPSRINSNHLYHYLNAPSGLSSVTDNLLGVRYLDTNNSPATTYPNILKVEPDTSTFPAQIHITSL